MKFWQKNLILLVIVAVLALLPLYLLPDAEFVGADDQAEEAISQINPEYQPWFESVFEPGSDSAEKWLFAFQAVLGCSFLVYYFRTKKKQSEFNPN